VVNCIHFSPTDHIIAFTGMITASSGGGQNNKQLQFTTPPVCVYKHKVNSSGGRKVNTTILPAMEMPPLIAMPSSTMDLIQATTSSTKSAGNSSEKFKSMLDQLDRMILDKNQENIEQENSSSTKVI
jgi:hypothetical protein